MLRVQDSWEDESSKGFGSGRYFRLAEITSGHLLHIEGVERSEEACKKHYVATNVDEVLAFLYNDILADVRLSVLSWCGSVISPVREIVNAFDSDGRQIYVCKGTDYRIYTIPRWDDSRTTLTLQTRVWPLEDH
ncbi:MAG: hypothetical protein JWR22_2201 [Herminiimonas sp.]|nr:hypothetical protein [Herminiimonas sp.]